MQSFVLIVLDSKLMGIFTWDFEFSGLTKLDASAGNFLHSLLFSDDYWLQLAVLSWHCSLSHSGDTYTWHKTSKDGLNWMIRSPGNFVQEWRSKVAKLSSTPKHSLVSSSATCKGKEVHRKATLRLAFVSTELLGCSNWMQSIQVVGPWVQWISFFWQIKECGRNLREQLLRGSRELNFCKYRNCRHSQQTFLKIMY